MAASLGQAVPGSGAMGGGAMNNDAMDLPGVQEGDDFERQLAQAIALSEQEAVSRGGAAAPSAATEGKSEKDLAREKRLAALAKRGL